MLVVSNLTKDYPGPQGSLPILAGVSLSLSRGEAIAVMGPSGSGKSTLLYILGALETPTSGTVTLDGQNPFALAEKDLAAFRNKQIGLLFQDHSLLPQCFVIENVLVPTLVAKMAGGAAAAGRARRLLHQAGLPARLDHRPAERRGTDTTSPALARALIQEPLLLLCDEPTGNLDHKSADAVASLLLDLHREKQTILVVVTHSTELASRFPARYALSDGRLHAQR